MTDADRRYHQCRHDACDSEARWQLLLQLHTHDVRDWNRPAFMLKIPSTLCVCDRHTKAALEIATNEHAKNGIRNVCWQQGYGAPDFSSMTAYFAPVDHESVVEQLKAG
ncbi:MAG TPA: hypothetical protein VEU47_13485 [Candidatus Cybelea sp.]|nr:hypothetical protein [Candidatus Cybelea sp.]